MSGSPPSLPNCAASLLSQRNPSTSRFSSETSRLFVERIQQQDRLFRQLAVGPPELRRDVFDLGVAEITAELGRFLAWKRTASEKTFHATIAWKYAQIALVLEKLQRILNVEIHAGGVGILPHNQGFSVPKAHHFGNWRTSEPALVRTV
jgi:hypothetical protein